MKVFFFGLGYCAQALIRREPEIEPSGTATTDDRVAELRRRGIEAYAFDGSRADPGVENALSRAEAIVVSIPPRGDGPLDHFAEALAAAPNLERIVYYSTVGVYGEHGGRWVDETSATLTRSARGLARLDDEKRWMEAGGRLEIAVDILRLPGIYGPGRNALVKLRQGEARRIVKSGHVVNRAHVDDIAEVTRLALSRGFDGQIWNVADDEPAPPQDVIAYAAATSRRRAAARGADRNGGALADGGELLRRGEAGFQRQGQGVARLRARLFRATAKGWTRCSRPAKACRRGLRRSTRSLLVYIHAVRLRMSGRRRPSAHAKDRDMMDRKLLFGGLAAMLAAPLSGCYQPAAYGVVTPAPVVGYGYGYGAPAYSYGYGAPAYSYGYGYGGPAYGYGYRYGGYGWRGGYYHGGAYRRGAYYHRGYHRGYHGGAWRR